MSSSTSAFRIVELTPAHYPAFVAHMRRHREESGLNGFHFMPFMADDPDGPVGVHLDKLAVPLTQPGWERAFVTTEPGSERIVGHVSIKSSRLRTMLHRCELGLGVESGWRGQGLGERLMETAIFFARQQQLRWVHLSTFAHNLPAQALYRKLGFREVGFVRDCFRLGDQSIDDVMMTLELC